MNSLSTTHDSATYQAIIAKTRELSFVYGLKRLTVDRIASECAVSKKTIYKYFDNKDKLIFEAADFFVQRAIDTIEEVKNKYNDPVQRLLHLFEAPFSFLSGIPRILIEDVYRHYPEIEERLQAIRHKHREVFTRTFNEGVKSGVFKDLNPVLIINFIEAAGQKTLNTQFLLQNNITVEETITCFKTIITNGIIRKK